ncbi:hypothetical protein C0991_012583 [Blastosporella zonata]|nr:hypothetical protein C0991_012583 [Blastosporella zonata]
MTLGDDLRQMSLNNTRDNPVTEAAKKGKAPTLLDVKKSVKSAERRFATFKLFYTDKAPANYEPPHFQAGDEEKDKWYFMTHDLDEVPDKWSIGKVNTGHHSVNLSVTSIATYLPSSTPHNNAVFGGTTLRPSVAPNLTPAQEASVRDAQAEQQIMDAQIRTIAWSGDEAVELSDADGDGEDDPDYMRLPDGSYKKIANGTPGVLVPNGIRNNKTGEIEPLSRPMDVEEAPEEAHFAGVSEKLPTKLNELASVILVIVEDMETQLEPIESFGDESVEQEMDEEQVTSRRTRSMAAQKSMPDNGLECECGVQIEDECCFCEGGCDKWFHVWCMGYHSVNDSRMPSKFYCFSCRLQADRFLIQQTTTLDDLGFPQIGHANPKTKAKTIKQPKARRNVQTKVFIFNREALRDVKYADYFNPDPSVEGRILKITEMTSRMKTLQKNPDINGPSNDAAVSLAQISLEDPVNETQTQAETQMMPHDSGLKRGSPTDDNEGTPKPQKKKMKISITHGLDLAE